MNALELTVVCLISALVGFFVGTLLVEQSLKRRVAYQSDYIEELEEQLNSYKKQVWGIKGKQVQEEQKERMELAVAEAISRIKGGEKPEDVFKDLLPKYPDIAMHLMRKVLKSK